jgi:hypothetical protein
MDDDGIITTYKKSRHGFIQFGKIAFSKKAFEQGKLRVLYWKSLNTLQGDLGKVRQISQKCIDCLEDMVYNKENFNMFLFFELNKVEQDIVIGLLKKSGVSIGFNYNQYLLNRLRVLQAEIQQVDNDNPELRKECIKIIKELHKVGKINKSRMDELIDSLTD